MDLDRVLAVPLGAGSECLGLLGCHPQLRAPGWSPVDQASALEIGHDLGAALLTARALERERTLVRELQELDDYRSQLFATLSHELRTPLTVISGNLQMSATTGSTTAGTGFLEAMGRGADRMQKVVDDLMLLARVSHPRHPLARLPIDLRAVAADVVTLLDSTRVSKGLTLDVDLDDGPLLVPGDPTELDQLIGNLVSNAVKYTPAGGTSPSPSAAGRRAGDPRRRRRPRHLRGGPGPDLPRLLPHREPRRAQRARHRPRPGHRRHRVERHGGRLEVTSSLGDGTTFTVTLPGVPQLRWLRKAR